MSVNKSLPVVLRYAAAYGLRRTLAKIAGRKRDAHWLHALFLPVIPRSRIKHISVIGCGQAAFATIAYYLAHHRGAVLLHAFDTDAAAAESLARVYGLERAVVSVDELLADTRCTHVYIASNHASHADYTRRALRAGKIVYCEKPVVTRNDDLNMLSQLLTELPGRFFAGYNRPFSPAVRRIIAATTGKQTPFTLSCYVHGHVIPADHWYRHAGEGTRICGNAGHWIDLFVHLYAAIWGELPSECQLDFCPADPGAPDDNFSLVLRTGRGDLFTLVMSARVEPTLGVEEQISFQCADVSAVIDDFRQLRLYSKGRSSRIAFRRKDVGHKGCVLQPFGSSLQRDPGEVLRSTEIMLEVMEAALRCATESAST